MNHEKTGGREGEVRTKASTAGLVLIAVTLALGLGAEAQGPCESWEFIPSPNPTTFVNGLKAVDGIAPDDVWAVGSSLASMVAETESLALHWDGESWSIIPVPPNPQFADTDLWGVAHLAADDAWAAGTQTLGSDPFPWILRWNGTGWSVATVDGLPGPAALRDIVAPAADELWVVGRASFGSALAARGDGSGSWQVEEVPDVGTFRNSLFAVDASSPEDIWAVGYWSNALASFHPLAAHWNGSQWSSMDVPSPGVSESLYDVAVVGPNDTWAAGEYYDDEARLRAWLVHWDGSGWTSASLPPFGELSTLQGVSAVASDDLWAVGVYQSGGEQFPLFLHYDGSGWTQTFFPDSGGFGENLREVAAIPGGDLWAVGNFSNGSHNATLTERLEAGGGGLLVGDANGDGSVDIGDATYVLIYLFAGGPPPSPLPVADANGDGLVDVSDAIYLLEFLFGGGPSPVPGCP